MNTKLVQQGKNEKRKLKIKKIGTNGGNEMNLRRKMEKLADKLNPNVLYFTENPINLDRYGDDYYGYRYFLVWQNTHAICVAFRTQAECIEYLEDLMERKIIWTHGYGFIAVLDEEEKAK